MTKTNIEEIMTDTNHIKDIINIWVNDKYYFNRKIKHYDKDIEKIKDAGAEDQIQYTNSHIKSETQVKNDTIKRMAGIELLIKDRENNKKKAVKIESTTQEPSYLNDLETAYKPFLKELSEYIEFLFHNLALLEILKKSEDAAIIVKMESNDTTLADKSNTIDIKPLTEPVKPVINDNITWAITGEYIDIVENEYHWIGSRPYLASIIRRMIKDKIISKLSYTKWADKLMIAFPNIENRASMARMLSGATIYIGDEGKFKIFKSIIITIFKVKGLITSKLSN